MNITRTFSPQVNLHQGSTSTSTQATSLHKPLKDEWQAPAREFGSRREYLDIDEMIQYAQETDEAVIPVTYEYKSKLTVQEKLQRARDCAIRGAVYGGIVVPFVGLLALGLGGAIGNSALGAVSGISSTAVAPALLDAGLAVGGLTVGMALLGGVAGFAQPKYNTLDGLLTKGEDGIRFTTEDSNRSVILEQYRNATTPPKVDGFRNYGKQWWNATT